VKRIEHGANLLKNNIACGKVFGKRSVIKKGKMRKIDEKMKKNHKNGIENNRK